MKTILTIFLTVFILVILLQIPLPEIRVTDFDQTANVSTDEIESPKLVFPQVEILASSAVVAEYPEFKIIYAKNADEVRGLASIAKLMTALVVNSQIPNTAMTFGVPILEEDILAEGDSGFFVGEEFSARALMDIMLVGSSNDAARALARSAMAYVSSSSAANFVDLMNKQASDLGLASAFFLNETGLDISEHRSSGFGSALDAARLLGIVLEKFPEALEAARYPEIAVLSMSGRKITVKNTNPLAGYLGGLIASKTGFTDIAGGNLTVAVDIGFQRPVIIAVLGSTEDGRFDDTLKLYEATKSYYSAL